MATDNGWENLNSINYDSISKKSLCMAKLGLWVNYWINSSRQVTPVKKEAVYKGYIKSRSPYKKSGSFMK